MQTLLNQLRDEKSSKLQEKLSELSLSTKGKFVKWFEDESERNYDFEKVNQSLLGKDITIKYFTLEFNKDKNFTTSCYKEITGKVIFVYAGYIVLDNHKTYSSHTLADFTITFN